MGKRENVLEQLDIKHVETQPVTRWLEACDTRRYRCSCSHTHACKSEKCLQVGSAEDGTSVTFCMELPTPCPGRGSFCAAAQGVRPTENQQLAGEVFDPAPIPHTAVSLRRSYCPAVK